MSTNQEQYLLHAFHVFIYHVEHHAPSEKNLGDYVDDVKQILLQHMEMSEGESQR